MRLIPYFWGMHLCQKRPNTEAKRPTGTGIPAMRFSARRVSRCCCAAIFFKWASSSALTEAFHAATRWCSRASMCTRFLSAWGKFSGVSALEFYLFIYFNLELYLFIYCNLEFHLFFYLNLEFHLFIYINSGVSALELYIEFYRSHYVWCF